MSRVPMTPLRSAYRRARDMDLETQLHECVEQLQQPERFAAEISDSHAYMTRFLAGVSGEEAESDWAEPGSSAQRAVEHFYASREVFVVHDSSSFTCLTAGYRPLEPEASDEESASDGFDYVAMTCTARPRPVLGVVQADDKTSAYTLLLRLLANLCDIAHEPQLLQMNRRCFAGALGQMPSFDLHLVLWEHYDDDEPPPERTPISQLSHDLAEYAKACFADARTLLPVLGDIVCLNMRPDRFDGRVRFDWRV